MSKSSHIQLIVGEEFQGEGKLSIQGDIVINAEHVRSRIEELQKETGNSFESLNYSAVLTCKGGNNEELKSLVDILWNKELTEEQEYDRIFRRLKRSIAGSTKAETQVVNNNFYLKLNLGEELAESVLGPVEGMIAMGLQEIAESQKNTISLKLLLNKTVNEIIESIKSGNRILAPLLSQAKFDFAFNLDGGLYEPLMEVLKGVVDEEIDQHVVALAFKNFKTFDLKLSLDSPEELPEAIRQKFLPSKNSAEDSEERIANLERLPLLDQFLKAVGSEIKFEVFIENFAHISFSLDAPQFSVLFLNYLGYIVTWF